MDFNSEKQPNVGKPVTFKNKKHYIAYEFQEGNQLLISKSKKLTKKFSVKSNQITYEQK